MNGKEMNEAAASGDSRFGAILKAVVVGAQAGPAQSGAIDMDYAAFTGTGVLEPPYDPLALCLLFEHSNSLRQNVDSYATNIDGFGQRFEPALDFEAEDLDQRIADIIYVERVAQREQGRLMSAIARNRRDLIDQRLTYQIWPIGFHLSILTYRISPNGSRELQPVPDSFADVRRRIDPF